MTALAKEPADRFPTAAAFGAALASPGMQAVTPVRQPAHAVRRAGWLAPVALVAAAAIGWAAASAYQSAATAPELTRERVRFAIAVDSGLLGTRDWWTSAPAVSPDGRTIVYAASVQGGARLYARDVDDLVARPLAGTEDADWPFFSPDGAWVGFASRGAIRKVRLTGGSPITITELRAPERFFGAHWGAGDTLIYSVYRSGALYRVPAAGGTPVRIAVQDTSQPLTHPRLLPDGRSLLVTSVVNSTWTVGRIGVLDLATGRLRRFGPGTGARYLAGHLYYASASGELFRQAFDVDALTLRGNPEEIATGLDVVFAVNAAFDVSSTGTLVYRASAGRSKLTLTDRTGRTSVHACGEPAVGAEIFTRRPPGRVRRERAGPGAGRRLGRRRLADRHLDRRRRVRSDPALHDGRKGQQRAHVEPRRSHTRLLLGSAPGGQGHLRTEAGWYARPPSRQPPRSAVAERPDAGRACAALHRGAGRRHVRPLDAAAGRRRARVRYLATPAQELDARISPDGRSVAYTSDVTGRTEVYLQAYPIPGPRVLVSARGGTKPVWRRDGRELYYWERDQLIVAGLEIGGDGPPAVRSRSTLFRFPAADPGSGYDVSPDGARFAIVTGAPRASQLVVAVHALDTGRRGPQMSDAGAPHPGDRIRESWVANAESWTATVREREIPSRRFGTDAAILAACGACCATPLAQACSMSAAVRVGSRARSPPTVRGSSASMRANLLITAARSTA